MSVVLDRETEERIIQEVALGRGRDAAEVINRALDLLEAQADERWDDEEKAELELSLEEGLAAIRRGEGLAGEQLRERLAARQRAKAA